MKTKAYICAILPFLLASCGGKADKVDLSKENWTRYSSISFGGVAVVEGRARSVGFLTLDKDYAVTRQGFIDGYADIHTYWYEDGFKQEMDIRYYFTEYITGNSTRLEAYAGWTNITVSWSSTKVNSVELYSIKGTIEKK